MPMFNKEYVHVVADENLYGKYGYFADNIDSVIKYVTDSCAHFWGKLSCDESSNPSFPFIKEENNMHYRFFYCDPGIHHGPGHVRRITNRELSLWLAHGNGEACYFRDGAQSSDCFTEFRYPPDERDMHVSNYPPDRLMIRRWYDAEWHEPTSDYIGLGGQG